MIGFTFLFSFFEQRQNKLSEVKIIYSSVELTFFAHDPRGDVNDGGKSAVEFPPANDGNSGNMTGGPIVETKLGDVAIGAMFGDIGIDGAKFGETDVVGVTAHISGDIDFFGMQGRKLGDVANESVRLDAE